MTSQLSKLFWIFLGIITLVVRYSTSAEWIEKYYSRGLFLWVRRFLDITLSWFPFPLIYIFFLAILWWLVRTIKKAKWSLLKSWRGWAHTLLSIFAFLGGGLFFFFLLWGYNYGRIAFTKQLDLKLTPIPVDTLFKNLEYTTEKILPLRQELVGDQQQAMDKTYLPASMETLVRDAVQKTLVQLGYPAVGKVRGRLLQPKGVFLRFSTAGLYWPFVGEGNIDSGLHPLQQPFTLAHELAHGYGITNEGVCNFIAFLACQQSDQPFIRYSGMVAYWRYLAIAYQGLKKEQYWAYRKQLPQGFQADMEAINKTLAQYPDIMPRFRNFAYDQYLKSQGISEGMASYSQIIMLVKAWEDKTKHHQ